MKYSVCFLMALFTATISFALPHNPGIFIKGKIANYSGGGFWISITGLFKDTNSNLPVDSNGNFTVTFPGSGLTESLQFTLNDKLITLPVNDGDTINMQWDQQQELTTFRLNSPNAARDTALQLGLRLSLHCSSLMQPLQQALRDNKIPAAEKMKLVRKTWQETVDSLLVIGNGYPAMSLVQPVYNNYYRYRNLMLNTTLQDSIFGGDARLTDMIIFPEMHYKLLDARVFNLCPEYRTFLYDYARFSHIFKGTFGKGLAFTPATDAYYLLMASVNVDTIRDYLIARSIGQGYQMYSYGDVENAWRLFQQSATVDKYKQQTAQVRDIALRTGPGAVAPAFTLRDHENKKVSLSDFKGKFVFLDFWGAGCGPCIYNIKTYGAGVHEKYKNLPVVFVNICVDTDEKKEWLESIHNLQLAGVNLIAPGWEEHPVAQAYNIRGIPHYLLIGPDGRIVRNNDIPLSYLCSNDNQLDELLKNHQAASK